MGLTLANLVQAHDLRLVEAAVDAIEGAYLEQAAAPDEQELFLELCEVAPDEIEDVEVLREAATWILNEDMRHAEMLAGELKPMLREAAIISDVGERERGMQAVLDVGRRHLARRDESRVRRALAIVPLPGRAAE